MTARNVPFQSPRNHAEEIANARYLAAAYGLPELEAPKAPERLPQGSSVAFVVFASAAVTLVGLALVLSAWVF